MPTRQAPNPDPVVVPDGPGRRRKSARGLNAFVVVKPTEVEALEPAPPSAASLDMAALGTAVSEAVGGAVATAIATQGELAERWVEAERRLAALEAHVRQLESERERMLAEAGERARTLEREREQLREELATRIMLHEAERERLSDEIALLRGRQLRETVEMLAEALTPRLCGVLDEHTAMADRYAAATSRIGELEARIEHLTEQVAGARAWRDEFATLRRDEPARPWWRFWR